MTNATQSVYVSIGRNVGDEVMPEHKWLDFRGAVAAVLRTNGFDIVSNTEGYGRYEGVIEHTSIIVGVGSVHRVPPLGLLGKLAGQYGQESIAVTIGEPIFVGGGDR